METASLNSLTGQSPLIFWVDDTQRIRRANATAQSMLGLTADELVNQPMMSLVAASSQERLERAGEGQKLLMELCRSDGRRLWVTYSVRRRPTDPDNLSVHTATPIGPASLDELIEERIQEERRAVHCELLGHVSHNVNNLLTTILSPAQLLLESTHDQDAREDILDILQATQRARALLREMYRAVRFEPESLESLSLSPLLTDIAERPMADNLQITLSLNPTPPVLGVADGLHTILHSLLRNAEEAGATTVNISVRAEGDRVLLAVRDNGCGIEPSRLSRLFEPFATSKPRVGAGLSLATSRTRLLGWGGNISVVSAPGTGTTFTLSLQQAPPPVQAEEGQRGRVLLIEDEHIIARALQRIFSAHDVDTALTASSALQMFIPGDYDVVLIDLGLPEMSGDELAEIIHARDPDAALLLLTGWIIGNDDPRMRLFDGRIQKPIDDLTRVRNKLDTAIRRTRDRRGE